MNAPSYDYMNAPSYDFTGLRALFINCTLKRSPEPSNTAGLVDISTSIMTRHGGVAVDVVRAVDYDIATGVWPDMREHGWATDDWPELFEKVLAADIFGAGRTDLARRQQLCDETGARAALRWVTPAERRRPVLVLRPRRRLPDHRQRGRGGEALCAERALHPAAHRIHHCAAGDAGWIGEAGPGPSYLDPGSGGPPRTTSPTATPPS